MKKKRSPLMVCCLILLALMLIASLFVASSALFNVGIVIFLHEPAGRFALKIMASSTCLPAYFPPGFVSKSCNTQSIPAFFCLRQTKKLLDNLRTSIESAVTLEETGTGTDEVSR